MKQLTLLFLFLSINCFSFAQTSLYGKITDAETGEDLIGANIILEENEVFKAGTSTDFSGIFKIDIDQGTYDVYISFLGYPTHLIKGVLVKPNQENKLDVELDAGANPEILIVENHVLPKKISRIATTTGCFSSFRITDPLPNRTIKLITEASLKCKFIGVDHENTMSWVWSKSYYLDGVLLDKGVSNVSYFDVDQIQVFSGGVPAAFEGSCDSALTLLSIY